MNLKTLNRYESKWPELKIFVILNLFLTKYIRIIYAFVKGFYQKMLFIHPVREVC